ncbi:MAG: TIGR00159 family protein [Planctomycetia bacterium]|nr:TIGR00159 family protein [Planctomycetia bacterium]
MGELRKYFPQSIFGWAEIAMIALAIYFTLRFLRKTVAGGFFRGPALVGWLVLLGFSLAARALNLGVIDYLFAHALPIFFTGLVILFQPELRHGAARLGESSLFSGLFGRRRRGAEKAIEIRAVDEVVAAVTTFAKRRIGALIAIERNVDLTGYLDTGVRLDAMIRAELLDTIFSTETLLHDGAAIVRKDRLAAAACRLPLTERTDLPFRFGTRHRAALGLSEQSDAVVVVVSEETGSIHVAERGELTPYSDPQWLSAYLSVVMAERTGIAQGAP